MYSLLNDRMQINIEINLSMVNPDQKYCLRISFTFLNHMKYKAYKIDFLYQPK